MRTRTLALVGIVLLALNLRTAIAALSPIYPQISVDVPLGTLGIAALGTLPPLFYAAAGLITPALRRRLGLEQLIIICISGVGIGHLVRAFAPSFAFLVVGSVIALSAMGVTNVLLPPIVKKYFPDRMGILTSLYIVLSVVATLLPPLISVPVTIAAGWRFSVGMWVVLSAAAVVPWIGLLIRHLRGDPEERQAALPVWRLGMSWAFALTLGLTTLNFFAIIAWFPEILHDIAGTTQAQSGALLAAYTAAGIVTAFSAPLLASRMTSTTPIIVASGAAFVVGYLGLLIIPGTFTVLWTLLVGVAPLGFPLTLTLINTRTRTWAGATALSGFAQGNGYLIAALGPLLVGVLHQVSGGWTLPIIFLLVSVVGLTISGIAMTRSGILEDQLPSSDVPGPSR